jgi:uncharacterized protein (DUF885 family)
MIKNFCTVIFTALILFFASCKNNNSNTPPNADLAKLFAAYWEDNLKLHPFLATAIGDNRYNDQFPNNQTAAYREEEVALYTKYQQQLQAISTSNLNPVDKESYDLLAYELDINLRSAALPFHQMPINQFWGFSLEFPQLGSGTGNQPFKTVKDYENFSARMKQFPAWVDSAIGNMRAGIAAGNVLPKALAEKIVPQIKGVLTIDPTNSIFYMPVKNMPTDFAAADQAKFKNMYFFNISNSVIPAYSKLRTFLEKEYIPACRATSGIGALPQGKQMYKHLIEQYTTTNLSADSIYNLGLQQVALLRTEMEKVKAQVGFTGSLEEFFKMLNTEAIQTIYYSTASIR